MKGQTTLNCTKYCWPTISSCRVTIKALSYKDLNVLLILTCVIQWWFFVIIFTSTGSKYLSSLPVGSMVDIVRSYEKIADVIKQKWLTRRQQQRRNVELNIRNINLQDNYKNTKVRHNFIVSVFSRLKLRQAKVFLTAGKIQGVKSQ